MVLSAGRKSEFDNFRNKLITCYTFMSNFETLSMKFINIILPFAFNTAW